WQYLNRTYGVSSMLLFGSLARDEQREDSDVDICDVQNGGRLPALEVFALGKIQINLFFLSLIRNFAPDFDIVQYRTLNEGIKVWRNLGGFRGEYSQFEKDCGGLSGACDCGGVGFGRHYRQTHRHFETGGGW
ncbi:MAG: nucleotidyltransferase domain-containing protein, partial [Bacteroidaceae bacterium]|nr:nucleotidyltransferase domain-containing protein [Bacteroidaceae bacterium]